MHPLPIVNPAFNPPNLPIAPALRSIKGGTSRIPAFRRNPVVIVIPRMHAATESRAIWTFYIAIAVFLHSPLVLSRTWCYSETIMDKLTQFVSKSFENNNNNSAVCVEKRRNSSPPVETFLKTEEDVSNPDAKRPAEDNSVATVDSETETKTKRTPVAKNWLISDTPRRNDETYGMDLRLNNPNVIYTSSLILNHSRAYMSSETPKPNLESPTRNKLECWYDNVENKTPSPKNSYSSSSSPIDLEDSKSCPETSSEKVDESEEKGSALENARKENISNENEKKLCKFIFAIVRENYRRKSPFPSTFPTKHSVMFYF